ncbi:hypothetical protein BLNAU_11228 [Blattamonas nauphoetae]|uniref:Protein kinase domain-containing protein n=1 Tax=Blattamonas nauphoetae TaxID=2049346 RepID=A0ABQ9XQN9_9EUKA|nr:hypothetical protein BLNAU_11228 [Blattamonas nauphoetae]
MSTGLCQGSTLKYGTLYTVVSLTSSSLHCSLVGSITFETPAAPPRIKTASCSLVGPLQRSGAVVLTGEALPAGESFSISLDEIDKNGNVIAGTTPITLSDTFDGVIGDAGLTTHTLSIELFPVAQLMKYSRRYRITSLAISTVPTVRTAVEETATFEVPAEPARIVGIWVELDSSGNTTSVTLRGRQIAKGSYTVRLNSESGPWFDLSFSDGVGDERNSSVASVSIFGDSPVMSFGTTYTLFSVIPTSSPSTPLLIDANPNSFTISEPSRITDITIGDFSDAQKTEATLTMTGRALKANTDYAMHVTGQPKSTSLMGANTEPDKRTITVRSDSTDPSESCSKTIKFFPLSSAEVLFGYEYVVDSVSLDGSTLLHNSDLSFFTPEEPSRLISISPVLAASLETVTLTFGGRCFDGSFSVGLQVTSPTSGTQFELQCSTVSETELTLTLPISTSDVSSVEFGDVLSVHSLKSDSSSAILEMSTFSIPHPPRVDTASFSFCSDLNTTFSVTLGGTDLPSHERFVVVLDSSHSFEVVITNSSSGTSAEMAIGWTDSLQYDTDYRIVSISNEESGKIVFIDSSVTFTTEKRPKQIVVFFDSSSSDSSRLCGRKDEPCSSMDSAWKIASNVGASDVSLRLILNATLSSPIVCLSNGIVVVEKGTSTEPTLIIPSSASMGEKGMISVSSGLFEIRDVDVVIESIVPSFVLLSGIDSTIVLRDGSIVGVKTRNESNTDEVLCEWDTGVLQFSNSTTNITDTVLSHLRQGAINIKGGSLSIVSSTFFDNSPGVSSFPSTRQNIRCSEGGEIEIGSLGSGDGSSEKHCHLWLSHDECLLSGADVNVDSPFFIPTLSPTSTSSFNKKDKTVTLEMIGMTLIPCDLFLEVFEVSKQKTIGKAERIKLDLDTTTSFTESSISLTLSQSSLSSLESSLEWRGRLLFGEYEQTTQSFLIQANSKDRIAQSVKENMKWWLPVAIVLSVSLILLIVIVFICWRRRKNTSKNGSLASQKELDNVDEIKIEVKDEFGFGTDVRLMGNESTYTGLKALGENSDTIRCDTSDGSLVNACAVQLIPAIRFNEQNEKVEEVMGNKMDTLYNRLHTPLHKPLRKRRRVGWEIGNGLLKIASKDKNAMILGFLSPHLIMFDKNDGIVFQQNTQPHGTPATRPSAAPLTTSNITPLLAEQSMFVSEEVQGKSSVTSFDGIRWMAPELVNRDGTMRTEGVDLTKAAVFSLGLVLFSIETGQVPFGEIDALSAHRQLSSGLLPLMALVSSEEMAEMITKCLSPVAKDRPSLSEIESFLSQEASKNPSLAQKANDIPLNPL